MSEDLRNFPESGEKQLLVIRKLIAGELSAEARAQLIDAYFDRLLKPEARDAFEQHYFTSDDFFREVQIREALIDALEESGNTVQARQLPGQPQTRNSYSWVYAAAAMLLIFLAIKIWLSGTPEAVDPHAGNGNSRQPTFVDLFGPAFAESPVFEAQLAANLRSTSGIVTVHSPENGTTVTSMPKFAWQWKRENPAGQVYLHIFDNRDQPLLDTLLSGTELQLDQTLLSGLYYWSLEGEEEVLHLGKFFVLPETLDESN